jgi:hypothetical protein
MRQLRYIALFTCLALSSMSFAQKEDWLPVTPQDQQIKEVPGDPGASAVQLYFADFIDDTIHTEFFYHRIKVLNEKGIKEHGDVEIPIFPGSKVSDLKARTIHPDGKIIEFTGKPFEKTIFKGKGIKFLAKTLALPEVTVGSIIEYKYRLRGDEYVVSTNNYWTIQHPLFTVKENLVFKAYTGQLSNMDGGTQVMYVTNNLTAKPKTKGSTVELEMENVPAFQPEGYMPPEENYKPQVQFFYGGSEMSSADKFWQEGGKRWYNAVEHFIGDHKEVKEAASEVLGAETDPEKKLRKLYARAQQVRNLVYERDRTEAEQKKEQLKPNENVMDVLKRGYGDRSDINAFFVGMARAAGFDASVVYVSSRKERFFQKNLLSRRQFDTEVALVQFNGKDIYLDPATRFCPYGLIRWIRTSTAALKLDKKGGSFVTIPPATQDKAVTQRVAHLALTEDGALKGDIAVTFKGGEALEHRLDALDTDEAGRRKQIEDELKSWLSVGANLKVVDTRGWEATDDPLTAQFSIEIPGYASVAGKRLLMPAFLFQAKQKDAFKHADCKFPVYFAYAFAEVDKVSIDLPAGYALESVPEQQDVNLPYARYQNFSQFDGKQLVTQRGLLFNGIFFDVNKYAELKGFFSKVQAGDEEQAVLRGGSINAQKSN